MAGSNQNENPFQSPQEAQPSTRRGSKARARSVAMWSGGLLTIGAISFGLLYLAPPLGLIGFFIGIPTWARFMLGRRLYIAEGREFDKTERMSLLGTSILIALAIGSGSVVAFCCTCTPVGFLVMHSREPLGMQPLALALLAGGIGAVGTMIWLLWVTRPKKL